MLKNNTYKIRFLITSILLLFSAIAFAVNEKQLIGVVDEATSEYTSGDNSFRVTIPVTGTRAYILGAVTDVFTVRGTLLSIKPTKNGSTYRLETTHALNKDNRRTPFTQASITTFDWYRRLATRSYRSPLIELNTYAFQLDGKQSRASIYKQFATNTQGPRFHLFYLTDFGNEIAFVWTDIPLSTENIEIEEQIINGNIEQARKSIAMLKSLKFE